MTLVLMGLLMLAALFVETCRLDLPPVDLIFSLTVLAGCRWGPLGGGLAGLWGGLLMQAATGAAELPMLALYAGLGQVAGLLLEGFERHGLLRRGLEGLALCLLLEVGKGFLLGWRAPDLRVDVLWEWAFLLLLLEAVVRPGGSAAGRDRKDLVRLILR